MLLLLYLLSFVDIECSLFVYFKPSSCERCLVLRHDVQEATVNADLLGSFLQIGIKHSMKSHNLMTIDALGHF